MDIIFLGGKQNKYRWRTKGCPSDIPFPFRFEYTKKKHFTQKPILEQKWLHQQYIVDAELFEDLSGFCVKCFFLYIRNEKENGKAPRAFCSSPIYVLFFTKKNYIHGAEGWGLFSWKIVNNWTMSRSSFCRYIFPEEWSNNNNVFFRSAIEGLCNVIFMFLVNT